MPARSKTESARMMTVTAGAKLRALAVTSLRTRRERPRRRAPEQDDKVAPSYT